jgi:uncharacterized protein DUF6894
MPRYYFDIHDDQFSTIDDAGAELVGMEAAKAHAIRVAASVAQDIFPRGCHEVAVAVRVAEKPVFSAKVVLTIG